MSAILTVSDSVMATAHCHAIKELRFSLKRVILSSVVDKKDDNRCTDRF